MIARPCQGEASNLTLASNRKSLNKKLDFNILTKIELESSLNMSQRISVTASKTQTDKCLARLTPLGDVFPSGARFRAAGDDAGSGAGRVWPARTRYPKPGCYHSPVPSGFFSAGLSRLRGDGAWRLDSNIFGSWSVRSRHIQFI